MTGNGPTSTTGRGSRLRRRLGRLGLLLTGLAIGALLAEAGLRLLDVAPSSYHPRGGFCRYDPQLGWTLVPGRRGTFRGEHFAVRVEINDQGLRDRVYDYDREPERRRILVLGDSVVWCWGVEMEGCFTERLERRLGDTDVIAMGVPGYGTAQELLLYEREGTRYRADVVLLVFVRNDPSDNLARRRRPVFRLDGDTLQPPSEPVPRSTGAPSEWLTEHSRLWVQLNHVLQVVQLRWRMLAAGTRLGRPGDYAPPDPDLQEEERRLTEALLLRLRDRVQDDGARFAIALAPAPDDLRGHLRELCAAAGIPLLDLTPVIDTAERQGIELRLRGDPHFSPEGQRVLADALEEFLGRFPSPALDG